ncbi:MAG: hypothetical protein JST54_10085 [Deltaproteobacteria bacterium]|nr:hypothetical protein [Deltaproteobacteria bacterium]
MARVALLLLLALPMTANARVGHIRRHLHLRAGMHNHVAPWALHRVRRAVRARHVDVPVTASNTTSNTHELPFKPEGLPGVGAGFAAARQMQQNWNGFLLAE